MHRSRCSFAIGFPSNHFHFTNGLVLGIRFWGGAIVKAGGGGERGVGEGGGGGGVGDGGVEEREVRKGRKR